MARHWRWLVAPLACAAIAATAWWSYSQRPPSAPVTGRPAPDFQLQTLAGGTASLASYRGKSVIVNFWATWCEPCKEEMPALQAAAAARQNLVILGVDNVEPAIRVRPFVDTYRLSFPILLDQDGSVIERYRVVGMPTSYFIDPAGTLKASYQGALTPEALQQDLALIGG
ncbi:MAG: redoxin domain-containing protein [Chloroflexi bacterium]|nr:redoxin domain-containing protein [Chloroflexota bacterium]